MSSVVVGGPVRAKTVLLAGLVGVLLVLGAVVALWPAGEIPRQSAPSIPIPPVAELLVTVNQVRDILPDAAEVGPGYRVSRARRDWRGNIKTSGLPTCNEWGVDLGGGLVESYHSKEHQPVTYFKHPDPRSTIHTGFNSHYVVAAVFANSAEALRAWERLAAAVDACPRRHHEPSSWGKRLTATSNTPISNRLTWSPEPVASADGWTRLAAREAQKYKAIRGKDDTFHRRLSYAMRGNVIFAQQRSIWGRTGDQNPERLRGWVGFVDWLLSARLEALAGSGSGAPCRMSGGSMSCQTEDDADQ